MPKRCPPGVICIENFTITFICIVLLLICVFIYYRYNYKYTGQHSDGRNVIIMPNSNNQEMKGRGDDVFFDIYKPPLRNDNCSLGGITGGNLDIRGGIPIRHSSSSSFYSGGGGMPINISTQSCGGTAPYRQVGILTRVNGKDETILPLMGRPLFTRRDKWNFYTLNDKNNMIKLPVRVKGRDATDEIGVDNVYTGDTVYVEGYNEKFKVTAYNNQTLQYLPDYI